MRGRRVNGDEVWPEGGRGPKVIEVHDIATNRQVLRPNSLLFRSAQYDTLGKMGSLRSDFRQVADRSAPDLIPRYNYFHV
jgi:hypothetical protein